MLQEKTGKTEVRMCVYPNRHRAGARWDENSQRVRHGVIHARSTQQPLLPLAWWEMIAQQQ